MPPLKGAGDCLIRCCYKYRAPNGAYFFGLACSSLLTPFSVFATSRLCLNCFLCVPCVNALSYPRSSAKIRGCFYCEIYSCNSLSSSPCSPSSTRSRSLIESIPTHFSPSTTGKCRLPICSMRSRA